MPATKPEQPELDAWALYLFDLGMTQKAIAAELGKTTRTVKYWIRRARLTEAPEFNFDDRLRILMNGSGQTCIHGVPMIELEDDRLCFCPDCDQTNLPGHRAWRRIKNARAREKTSLYQPRGTPTFIPHSRPDKKRNAPAKSSATCSPSSGSESGQGSRRLSGDRKP